MTEEQMKQLDSMTATVSVSELTDKSERTLIWGYTLGRDSWHVYLKGGRLVILVYTCHEKPRLVKRWEAEKFTAEQLVPDKRLYPEACDFEFCRLLASKGATLPFTTFNPNRPPQQFHGLLGDAFGQ